MTTPRLRLLAIVCSVAGLGIASYLTWVHYAGLEAVCFGGSGGCEKVQSSNYATLAGVPVALLGAIGYLTVASLLLSRVLAAVYVAAIALSMLAFSLYLTAVEIFAIKAICQWCVASAVLCSAMCAAVVVLALREERAAAS